MKILYKADIIKTHNAENTKHWHLMEEVTMNPPPRLRQRTGGTTRHENKDTGVRVPLDLPIFPGIHPTNISFNQKSALCEENPPPPKKESNFWKQKLG
jgi:hypothetical protein